MASTATAVLPRSINELEYKLEQQQDPLQRLITLDILASHYCYTNVQRAREVLEELHDILAAYNHPDYLLNYHFFAATVENQLYHYAEAEHHFLQGIKILGERGTAKQQAEAYIDIAGVYMNLEQLPTATDYLDKANKLLRNFPDKRLQARITCREGFLNLHYGNYPRAVELLLQADRDITMLGQPLELKDYYFLTLIHSGLGKVYERNDDREKSVMAYLKVVNMCDSMGIRTRLSWHYVNVGIGYIALNDQENAETYFRKAIDVADDISEFARASAFANLGFCYYEKGDHDEALRLFDRAEHFYRENKEEDYYNFSILESWRRRLHADLGNAAEALHHYSLALEYAQKIEDYKQLAGICKDFARFYASQQDYGQAYHYQCLHDTYAGQYVEQVDKRRQMELEVKYEAEKKKQEAELLRLQATRLQLNALRAQMNPHFMYNALNSIQNYITSNEVTSAAKSLAKFAQLMRRSLEYSDLEIISLEKEIEFLEEYLHLNEKLRFEDRLSYEIIIDEDIEEDILGVPTMIIQPYVENAIEHGLRTKKDGLIRVLFFLYDEDTILCVVEDNGIGRKKAQQLRLQDPQYHNHRSRGTSITEERLEVLRNNAEDQGQRFKTIDLEDEQTGEATGTRVEIMIPVMEIQMK